MKNKLLTLSLTKDELTHLRDLMSLTDFSKKITLSEHLSNATGKNEAEKTLWKNVFDLCKKCDIKIANEAPNYQLMFSERWPSSRRRI